MSITICRHIRSNGARCTQPALRDRAMCFHHIKVALHHRHFAAQPSDDDATPTIIHPIAARDRTQRDPLLAEYYRNTLVLDLPPLEDRESIQIALSMIITAMAQNRIDPKFATAILYGLQVASANARDLSTDTPKNVVRDVVTEDGQQLALDEDPTDPAADDPLSRLVDNLQHIEPEPNLDPINTIPDDTLIEPIDEAEIIAEPDSCQTLS